MIQTQWRLGAGLLILAGTAMVMVGCGGSGNDDPALHQATAADLTSVSDLKRVLAYDRPDVYGTVMTPDILIPMRDGFALTCNLYLPATVEGVAAPGAFPSILMNFTPYGRISSNGNDIRHFANKGYALVWCNTRGSNGVDGASPAPQSVAKVQPLSPQEQQDNYDTIEWIAGQPWSTGHVGQIGTSYGAMSAYLVAGRQAPPHLKAIIAAMGTPNLYADFAYQDGIVRPIPGTTRKQFAARCSLVSGEATCSERLTAEWALHSTFDEYWVDRTADPAAIKVPTLSIGGFMDYFIMGLDQVHAALKDREDSAVLIGPWFHQFPESSEKSPLPKGVYLAWFDRYLSVDVSAPQFPKASIQGVQDVASNSWHQYDAWPPKEATLTKFYLAADGKLQVHAAPTNTNSSYAVAADGSSGKISFKTAAFEQRTTLAGQVKVTLTAAFSANDGNVIAEVYDRSPDGSLVKLGHSGYMKASHRSSHEKPAPATSNLPYQLTVLIPSKYWTFEPGHSMEIAITSADENVGANAPAGMVSIIEGLEASFVEAHLL